MKNLRLYLISILLLNSLIIGTFIWYKNLYQIDFFRTKNDGSFNLQINQIKNSNDIEFIKNQAINSLALKKENIHRNSEEVDLFSKLIFIQLVLILLSTLLITIEIKNKKSAQ